MKTTVFWQVVLVLTLLTSAISRGAATPETACTTPEHHQFDFWAGDWDAYDMDSPNVPAARVHVDRILNGCVLHELYQATTGHTSESFSTYDASRKVWHQSWVTNAGYLLLIDGQLQNGSMVLSGTDRNESGAERLVRGTWQPVNSGVRETAVRSLDGGKTWQPWFDMMFRPHAGSADGDAGQAVIELDRRYQAAVEKNDAATMDAILADNFVLVTGSGKTYTKADLLQEARSGRIAYERQADSDQKVHVWGDTAVITAKLIEKGTDAGKPFDYTLWFSDTYVKTPSGWRYVFGQSALPK